MSNQALERDSISPEEPPEEPADVNLVHVELNLRGFKLRIREDTSESRMVWIKVEGDQDGELNVSPQDIDAVSGWIRTFLRMRWQEA